MNLKERLKTWAPYIMSDGLMYIVMFLAIGIGIVIMIVFKL